MWKDFKFCKFDEVSGDIQVRLVTKNDAKLLSQYFCKNREHLRPWEPIREAAFFTELGWKKKLIKLNELHLLELGFYCVIIHRVSGEALGTVSFSNLARFPLHSCSVGYSLDKDWQGRGIMTTVLKLACNWMFSVQNMHRITASYMPSNVKSSAVLQANGFEDVGYAKDYLLIDGKWEDHHLTALINKNWQNKNDK